MLSCWKMSNELGIWWQEIFCKNIMFLLVPNFTLPQHRYQTKHSIHQPKLKIYHVIVIIALSLQQNEAFTWNPSDLELSNQIGQQQRRFTTITFGCNASFPCSIISYNLAWPLGKRCVRHCVLAFEWTFLEKDGWPVTQYNSQFIASLHRMLLYFASLTL